MSELADLTELVLAFRDERDWAQFHTPRNLAAALAVEVSEIQELLLWKGDEQVATDLTTSDTKERMAEEVGDVLIYALLLAHAADVDPARAVRDKLAKNARKYPVELARGRADKYTQLAKHQERES